MGNLDREEQKNEQIKEMGSINLETNKKQHILNF